MGISEIIIETIGWVAGLLVLGSYMLNISGKLSSESKPYIICNAIGGLLFVIFTYYKAAWPNLVLNAVWMLVALNSLLKKKV